MPGTVLGAVDRDVKKTCPLPGVAHRLQERDKQATSYNTSHIPKGEQESMNSA